MNQELGTAKAEAWRSSKKLPTRPDRVTGSSHEDCLEYGCPEDWESWVQENMSKFTVSASGEADDADLALLDITAQGGASSTEAEVKIEKPQEADSLKKTHC